MNRNEVLEKVCAICKDVFDNEKLLITETISATDVAEWDSLTHLSLIDEIEQAYDIRFTLDEVLGSKNIGELIDALIKHIEEKHNE